MTECPGSTDLELPEEAIAHDVARALREDVGAGDLSAAAVPDGSVKAHVIVREAAVIAGLPWFCETLRQVDETITARFLVSDSSRVEPGQEIASLHGPARSIMTAERTALNFLQFLSGTATRVRRYVDALEGRATTLLDTRKTIPGLRAAQKYAVRCGGGSNHRQGLFDAVLIKENHIMAAGSIEQAVRAVRQAHPTAPLVIEVESIDQIAESLATRPDRLLLDNFSIEALARAVLQVKGRAVLEASGNVTLDNIAAVADTGVDVISVGDLPKNVRALDLSLRLRF